MNKKSTQYFTISSLLNDSKKEIPLPYIKGDIWHNSVVHEYHKFNEIVPHCNRHINFLIYSGITFPSSNKSFLYENIAYQYSYSISLYELNAFSRNIHNYFLKKVPFVIYISCIAYPCNIFVHFEADSSCWQ